MNVRDRFDELVKTTSQVTLDPLFELFDALEPIPTELLIGEWEGGVFGTGHPGEEQLKVVGWVGKTFRGDDDVDPIIVHEGGRRVASPVMGCASLRLVVYRGAPTATMIYDKHPIFDHFRKIDDDLVVGVMHRKGDAAPLFFFLSRRGGAG